MTGAGAGFRVGQLSLGIQTDKAAGDYREIARTAEAFGFDAVSTFADLGFQPPLPALLAMAEVTERIRLGAACWNATLLHPVEIAGQIAALDAASGGRGYLGITRGAWLDRIGLPPPGGIRRVAEAVEVIGKLLAGDDSGFSGEHFRIDKGFRLRYPLPRRPVPVLLGVWGPRGARLAARVAEAVKLGGCANPAMIATMSGWLAAGCASSGRPPGAVTVVAGAVTVVDRDRERARRLARAEVAMYVDVVAGMDRTVQVDAGLLAAIRCRLADGDPAGAGELIDDRLLDLFAMAGNPDDVARHALELLASGAGCVEFGTPHGITARDGIELLGAEVLPRVRGEWARTART